MALLHRSILSLGTRATATLIATCALGTGQFARAEVSYVVELFTSQGCSSCPRADEWLASVARQPDIVAVSFPVDYWDFMGWRDTLASPSFTARQKAYAAAHGALRPYIPQAIVNGLADAPGNNEAEIEQAIQSAKGRDGAMTVPMRLSKTGDHYIAEVAEGSGGPADVFVLRVLRGTTVRILRGENAGRSIVYTNVVRRFDKLGEWTGESATFAVPGEPEEGEGFIVLLQKGTPERPGVILGAAKTDGL